MQRYAKNQKNSMPCFFIKLEKPYFGPLLTQKLSNKISAQKSFESIISLYPTVNLWKKLEKVHALNFNET